MDLKTRNQHRSGIEVAALAGVEAAGVSPCELNAINFGDTLWSLRACTGIVLVFQAIYLAADWSWVRVHDDAILPLHIFNILNAAIFLRLTHIRTYRDHMPQFYPRGLDTDLCDNGRVTLN